MKINLGIIGLGYFGPNYVRVACSMPNINLLYCCDTAKEKKNICPAFCKFTTNYKNVLSDKKIDAVAIVTPTKTHFKIIRDAVNAGKHVLSEKPLTFKANEAKILTDLSKKKKKYLMAAHIFLFNPAVSKIKEILEKKYLGNILYMHFRRTAYGPVRNDVNVIFDLAPHDISILNYLIKDIPKKISAFGEGYLKPNREDIAFLNIEYKNKTKVAMHLSWLDPEKRREILIVGTEKMLLFDDMQPKEKIKIFKAGSRFLKEKSFAQGFQMSFSKKNIETPHIKPSEPLKKELYHFIDAIKGKTRLISDANFGYKVVKILNSANESLKKNGKIIKF